MNHPEPSRAQKISSVVMKAGSNSTWLTNLPRSFAIVLRTVVLLFGYLIRRRFSPVQSMAPGVPTMEKSDLARNGSRLQTARSIVSDLALKGSFGNDGEAEEDFSSASTTCRSQSSESEDLDFADSLMLF